MVTQSEIEKVARDIGKAASAERVILFGSYASGHASESSDVDLMVIADSKEPRHKRSRELYRSLQRCRFPVDILVYTPAEVRANAQTPVSFIAQVLREGRIVYVR